jgi:hypothetical protein
MLPKLKSTGVLAVLCACVLFYSSCQKSETKTTGGVDAAKFGSQLALNIYNSFNGSLSGTDLTATKPGVNAVRNGIKTNEFTCGQVIETPVSFSTNLGDTVKGTVSGTNKITINCTGGAISGYALINDVTSIGFNPTYSYDYIIKENYTVKSLAANYDKMEVNGTQTSVIKTQSKKNKDESSVQNNSYVMTGFIIDATNRPFDITAGSAQFVSEGTNDGRTFSFAGIVEFLGGHKAKVSFDGKIIMVDLLTGKTTQI